MLRTRIIHSDLGSSHLTRDVRFEVTQDGASSSVASNG